jgi:hypothetical protein
MVDLSRGSAHVFPGVALVGDEVVLARVVATGVVRFSRWTGIPPVDVGWLGTGEDWTRGGMPANEET